MAEAFSVQPVFFLIFQIEELILVDSLSNYHDANDNHRRKHVFLVTVSYNTEVIMALKKLVTQSTFNLKIKIRYETCRSYSALNFLSDSVLIKVSRTIPVM